MERLALAAISIALILVAAAACNTGDRVVAIVDDPGPGPGPLPPGNVPQLTVSEVHHSFGGVEVGASATATFRISNAGSGTAGPLAPALAGGGKSFVTDGACAGRSLGPGAWCEVRVTFRPEAFGRKEAALAIAESLSVALEGYGRGSVKLSLQSTGGGRLNFCFAGPCTVTFEVGETVPSAHVEATADAEWTIAAWSGDCTGSRPDCELLMDRDRAAAVTFVKLAKVSVEASVLAGGGGEIRIDPSTSCHAPCRLSTTVPLGTAVTLHGAADSSSQFRWTQDCPPTNASCAFTVTADTNAKIVFNGANYVFVTSTKYSSNAGVAAYDAACNERAQAAGLPGPYVAWVTTTSTPAERRLGNARGFIRLDGLPFMDVIEPGAPAYYPVLYDDREQPVPPDLIDRMYLSGRSIYGGYQLATCSDWTTDDPSWSRSVITGDPLGGYVFWDGWASTTGCSLRWRLLCVGSALTRPLQREREQGRFAFASDRSTPVPMDRGIQGFDETCAAQAGAAGLPGAYKALVATDGASAISRFDLNGPPWVRPDGVAIVARAADLADGKLIAPLDVHADSKGDADVFSFWTGAPTPGVPGSRETTCNAWTSISADVRAIIGRNSNIEPGSWFDLVATRCDATGRVYCFQQ